MMMHPPNTTHPLPPPSSSPPRLPRVHSHTSTTTTNHYALLLSLLDRTHTRTQSLTTLSLPHAESIHAQILKRGLHRNVKLAARLHPYYPPAAADALLASLPKPDVLTWNLLIASCHSAGRPALALHLLSQMLSDGFLPDEFTLPSALNSCAALPSALPLGRAAHARALICGHAHDPFVASALIDMYAACGLPASAEQVLDESPSEERDLPTWNSAISGLARQGEHRAALRVFARMRDAGVGPNRTTLSSAVPACGRLPEPGLGRAIHGHVVKSGEEELADVSVSSALVFMYAKCGDLEAAVRVFRSMPERNVVSWNSIISAHAQASEGAKAWELFREMLAEGYGSSEVTLTCMATASGELVEGRVVHGFVIKVGLAGEEITGAAIIDMYARLGSLDDARKVFDEVPRSEMGSWNSMILSYSRNGRPREALNLFYRLRDHTALRPNSITLVGALRSCAALGAVAEGKAIHDYIVDNGIGVDLIVGTALVDMYSKCGSAEAARHVFEGMGARDLVAWSVMIAGYGINGQVGEAMELFDRMVRDEGVPPDNVTFTSVLSACSHAGMVREGWDYFDRMKEVYGLEAKDEQYACMVDLLGRAGKLDEALSFIEQMPIEPDESAWGALLGACRIHKNIELGAYAAEKLFELDPSNAGYYVLLSNLYAAAGRWKDVTRVREQMKLRGVQKPPGCSWVDLDGTMHEFYVGDKSHAQSEEIYRKLDELGEWMKELGYVADTDLVLHDVDDEVKEEMLSSHSERLAIAFALINTGPGEAIRVTKNLRVCADCHRATKLISKITGRRIVVRDARRFHHFEHGECSEITGEVLFVSSSKGEKKRSIGVRGEESQTFETAVQFSVP